ncbi:MAG: NADH-quinone oxidoreductase subunit NuoF [Dehalococcoidales bacterium]|nr:NADH-quinone oxidoreductase subunit NuoF [Dehalococcoidales bacterium]
MTFEEIQKQAVAEWGALQQGIKPHILVGTATCGRAAGAMAVLEAINQELSRLNIDAVVSEVGCVGVCYAEPLVDIAKPGHPRIIYSGVTPEIISELLEDYLVNDNPRADLALGIVGEGSLDGISRLSDLPVFKPQVRISTRNCGHIDPTEIKQYIANGGYSGFLRALKMTPDEVIGEVKKSGLRGRGGAGFPTGQKWEFCRRSPGTEKYLICNADEGDPGAFMNRSQLESDPHAVLEGMLIGAYAMGTSHGYIYCRAEYPLAIERLNIALDQMRECGLLGDNILGSGFNFEITIKEGAGAFVCGEETALMASIEGKRGMPRPRPPFPAVSGLWGKPTNINNVGTWADVAAILQKGAEWYAGFGTEKSKGTKTFSLAGKVVRTGLIEVPLGIPLSEIIYNIGGGIVNNKQFKAVQTGGPSGGCLPASLLDIPVDYESLAQAGSIVGSGGMVVADEDTCMVDMVRFFLAFVQDESCGKCVPCRVGTRQMLNMLERITRGEGKAGDIERLEQLAQLIKGTALCGLGQTAPNPILTTLRYFRKEFEEHVEKGYCRAGVCKRLVKSPCQNACPAGIDVPRYVRAIGQGKYGEAVAVIREKIPFPSVCGYVCVHFCEAKCRRGQLEEAIAIKELKRFAADHDTGLWKKNSRKAEPTGKRVAVVGSGPAGLTAAYYLAILGHKVTVFESLPVTGGMMRVGIPSYRLPEAVLDAEIKEIENLGVEIKTNSPVESLDGLFGQGYQSVFVSVGAHRGTAMGIEGENTPGVVDGVDFLREVNLGKKVDVGDRVLVVGGGNVAIDAARTALRLGAKEVNIVYRRTRLEMPASAEEIEEALEEGVKMQYLAAPTRVMKGEGRLKVELIRMELGKVDASGRARPVPVEGSQFTEEYTLMIKATGQESVVPDKYGLEVERGGRIKVDPETMLTTREGVYAGGDTVSGPASVIEAIAAGRQAAVSIDRYLGGEGIIDEVLAPPEGEIAPVDTDEVEGEKYRPPMEMLPLDERLKSFAQVVLGFDNERATEETKRCLRCDLEER